MRNIWWFAIGGSVLLLALLVGLGFVFFGSGQSGATGTDGSECLPTASIRSAGNAQVTAKALGKGFGRTIVIRVNDKQSGTPLHEADVKIHAEMTCPHVMPLYERTLSERSTGTYKGDYNLVMPGDWTFFITVRSKEGDATTTALPVRVIAGR